MLKRVGRLAVWAVVLTIGAPVAACAQAAANDSLGTVEKELEAKWKEVKAFSASMYVKAEIAQSGIALTTEMTGPMVYQRTDNGVVRYRSELKGKAQIGHMSLLAFDASVLTVSDGVTQYAENHILNKVTVTKTDAAKRKDSDPAGGSKALNDARKKYDLRVLPEEVLDGRAMYVIEGRPKPGEKVDFPGLDRILMYFDKATGIQAKMTLLDQTGKTLTEILFSNVQMNPQIDPSMFVYQVPAGAQVIDKTAKQ